MCEIVSCICNIATVIAVILALYQEWKQSTIRLYLNLDKNKYSITKNKSADFVVLTVWNKGIRPFRYGCCGIEYKNGSKIILPVNELYFKNKDIYKLVQECESLELYFIKEQIIDEIEKMIEENLLSIEDEIIFFVRHINGYKVKMNTHQTIKDFIEKG